MPVSYPNKKPEIAEKPTRRLRKEEKPVMVVVVELWRLGSNGSSVSFILFLKFWGKKNGESC
jgi:hypothetical protein